MFFLDLLLYRLYIYICTSTYTLCWNKYMWIPDLRSLRLRLGRNRPSKAYGSEEGLVLNGAQQEQGVQPPKNGLVWNEDVFLVKKQKMLFKLRFWDFRSSCKTTSAKHMILLTLFFFRSILTSPEEIVSENVGKSPPKTMVQGFLVVSKTWRFLSSFYHSTFRKRSNLTNFVCKWVAQPPT